MILEYISIDGIPVRVEIPDFISGVSNNIDVNYLDDTRFLYDPANGYFDINGTPSQKLFDTLRNVEKINGGTWEFLQTNISRLDKRVLRGGKTRGIPTLYNVSGDTSKLINGIGSHDDLQLIEINQEREPSIMSRDLFISNLPGFITGGTSGIVTEIDYSQILNPINTDNINNFFSKVKHGYLYFGEKEYYLYGAKETELFAEDGYQSIDEDGYRFFGLSGVPNEFSPIVVNIQSGTMHSLLSDIEINNYTLYRKNVYRDDFSGLVVPIKHNLITKTPFVYIVQTDGTIILPSYSISNLNNIIIENSVSLEGKINVLRPNKYFRTFAAQSGIVTHGLYTNNLLGISFDENNELGIVASNIIDINSAYIDGPVSGTLTLFNLDELGFQEDVSGFTSGILNTPLSINPAHEAYVDPWIFGTNISGEVIIPSEAVVQNDGSIYVDFLVSFDGTINIVNFADINEAGILYDKHTSLSTDLFPFTDIKYRGNEGIANPIHQTYPLTSNQQVAVSCECFECLSDNQWLSGLTSKPAKIVYTTEDNTIVIPPSFSGNVVVHYEKKNTTEYMFRDADLSPVSWINTDRVLAIELEKLDPYQLELIPDSNSIKLSSGLTRPIGFEPYQQLSENPTIGVSGEPTTNMNITINVIDEAFASCSGEIVTIRSDRKLYDISGNVIDASISIVDNTAGLFAIPQSQIDEMDPIFVDNNSIFDNISLTEVPVSSELIFDTNGFLFNTLSGIAEYRVPFFAAIYDATNDTLVHEMQQTTDKFGVVNVKIGFHNNDLQTKIRKTSIRAYVNNAPDIGGETLITIIPAKDSTSYGITNEDSFINNTLSKQTNSEYLTIITDSIIPVSPTYIATQTEFNNLAGLVIPDNSNMTNIDNVYQVREGYLVNHTSHLSGEVVYIYCGESQSLLNVGETYGNN